MHDPSKTYQELIEENILLKQRILELEKAEAERKQAEDALLLSNEIMANMSEGVILISISDGIIVYANPKFERMFGYDPEELKGKNVSIINAPTSKTPEEVAKEISTRLRDDGVWSGEVYNKKKDGTTFWCYSNVSTFKHPVHGDVWVSVHSDITERKRAEEALYDSERKFRAIFDQTFQFIGLMAIDGTLIEANRTALKFSGIEEVDVIGKPFWMTPWWIHSPNMQDKLRAAIKKASEGEFVRFEATHRAADGSFHYIDFSLKPVMDESGNVVLLIPEGRDITERKRVEEAVLRAKEDWERTFYAVPDLIAILDTEYRIVRANRAMASRLGTTPEECVGLTCYCTVHGTTEPPVFCPHRALLEDGFEHTVEVHEDRLGGDYVVSVSPLRDSGGKLIGSIHIAHNITERKRMEEALRESENKFRILAEKAVVGVYLIQDDLFRYINPRLADMLGYTVDELATKVVKLKNIIAQEDWMMAREYLRKRLSGEFDSIHYEVRMIKKSGDIFFVEALGSRIIYNGRPAIIGTLLDISDRKRAEEEQRHREKLQGTLEMAGAICHEMNQPMQIISGFSELLMKDISENDPIYEKLGKIIMQIERMSIITKKLMKIKDYETQDYAGMGRIIDINKSSDVDTD
ncbi:MAG TPA: PAS domain S-box protein [Syntrophales bacterium]|nr:PAS domain S-box protein [Syntrophales bacterium]